MANCVTIAARKSRDVHIGLLIAIRNIDSHVVSNNDPIPIKQTGVTVTIMIIRIIIVRIRIIIIIIIIITIIIIIIIIMSYIETSPACDETEKDAWQSR